MGTSIIISRNHIVFLLLGFSKELFLQSLIKRKGVFVVTNFEQLTSYVYQGQVGLGKVLAINWLSGNFKKASVALT